MTGIRPFDNGVCGTSVRNGCATHPEFRYRLRKRRIFSFLQPIERQGPDGTSLQKCSVDENGLIGIEVLGETVEIRIGPKVTTLSRLFSVDSALLRKEEDGRGASFIGCSEGKADVKARAMAGNDRWDKGSLNGRDVWLPSKVERLDCTARNKVSTLTDTALVGQPCS